MSKYSVTIKDKNFEVELNGDKGKIGELEFKYDLKKINGNLYLFKFNDSIYETPVVERSGNEFCITLEGLKYEVIARTELEEKSRKILAKSGESSAALQVNSPMPGLILKVFKKAGEEVKKGEPLLVLEAMKMENEIKSPKQGKVVKLFVEEGSKVEKNEPMITIE